MHSSESFEENGPDPGFESPAAENAEGRLQGISIESGRIEAIVSLAFTEDCSGEMQRMRQDRLDSGIYA
jgi:hypothetical protein